MEILPRELIKFIGNSEGRPLHITMKERMRLKIIITRLNILPILWGKLVARDKKCTRVTTMGHMWREGTTITQGIMQRWMGSITYTNGGNPTRKIMGKHANACKEEGIWSCMPFFKKIYLCEALGSERNKCKTNP